MQEQRCHGSAYGKRPSYSLLTLLVQILIMLGTYVVKWES